jgi:hypothetical protein
LAKNYLNDEHRICAKMAQKYLSDEQKIMQKIKMDSQEVGWEFWTGLLWPRLGTDGCRL